MRKTILFVLFLGVIFTKNSYCQNNYAIDTTTKSNISIRIGFSPALIITTNDFLRSRNKTGEPITKCGAISSEIVFQTTGRKYWHQLYHFPKFGFGVSNLWFPQTNELGTPIALYAFLDSPLHKWKKSDLSLSFNFGIAFGWNAYDSIHNPYDVLLGSKQSVFSNLALAYSYHINKKMGVQASLGFTHSSNGALKMPNYGINLLYPKIAFSYNVSESPNHNIKRSLPKLNPTNEVSLTYSMGTKQIDVTGSNNDSLKTKFRDTHFTIYNLVLLYQRQISRLSKVGIGLDYTIDPSDNAHGLIAGDLTATYFPEFKEQSKLAVTLSYELAIGKLSLIIQPSFYFYRTKHDPTPLFYQRIGTRYDVWKGLYTGASLRAVNFGQADWIEFSIGYKVKF